MCIVLLPLCILNASAWCPITRMMNDARIRLQLTSIRKESHRYGVTVTRWFWLSNSIYTDFSSVFFIWERKGFRDTPLESNSFLDVNKSTEKYYQGLSWIGSINHQVQPWMLESIQIQGSDQPCSCRCSMKAHLGASPGIWLLIITVVV